MSLRDRMGRFIRDATIRCHYSIWTKSHQTAGAFVRFEVLGLYDDAQRAETIATNLGSLPGVLTVRPNSTTGNVLVHLQTHDARIIDDIEHILQTLADPYADPAPSLRSLARKTRAAIQNLFQELRNGQSTAPRHVRHEQPYGHASTIDELLNHFRVDPQMGLDEAHVERSRREFGRNVLAGIRQRSKADIFAAQVFTFPCALLFGSAGLSLFLGDLLEAGAIVLVIGCNIAVGYFSESRAEELLDAWRELRAEWATVVRHGQQVHIAAADVVPGDVLVIRAGDPLPADARLFWTCDLFVDESMLTGESEPAEKNTLPVSLDAALADRRCMLFAGTVVVAGQGRAIVVATGESTELGAIEYALGQTNLRKAPMEQQLEELGKRVAKLAAASSTAVIVLGLLRGRPFTTLLRSAIALGVAAIPEGFPAVGTTALALASHRLRREGIVIRRLVAAETLGAVQVLCADKTGTLTENKMRVEELVLPNQGLLRVEWPSDPEIPIVVRAGNGQTISLIELRDLLRIVTLNADVTLDATNRQITGSGTEKALVEFARSLGYPVAERRSSVRRIHERRRTPDCAMMFTVHDHPDLGRIELVKGAPEQILTLATNLSELEKESVLTHNEILALRGLRVLGFAWRRAAEENEPFGYSFAGLIGLQDPPRQGVRDALAILSRAGISTHMLTGDQRPTALAIGRLVGLSEQHIHSRVTPSEKLEIVRQLQTAGQLVAMTGDGVNDGPALKAADVGIAMGRRGTDVARAVADVVLAGDDLPAIVKAIAEGRRLHDNVHRAIHYLAATNSSEVITMLVGAFVGITPLEPLQLLWVNILTDIAPALALAVEPAETNIMERPPRNPEDPLFSPNDLRRLLRHGTLMATSALTAYGAGAIFGSGPQYGRTMAFLSLITAQILYTQTCRAHSRQTDPALSAAVVTSFGLQTLAFGVPVLRSTLKLAPLSMSAIGTSLFLGAFPTWLTHMRPSPRTSEDILIFRRSAPKSLNIRETFEPEISNLETYCS
ncbi:MAG TPA: cation-transporting P-type ATPase [Polyangium sp.]|nr:cation-transporting P-type ATPase [Polyangium sp.]